MPAPRLSAELFTVPVDDAYLIYAPLRQAAFLANRGTVNRIADLAAGRFDSGSPLDDQLLELLRQLEIVDAGPEELPVTRFEGEPRPTSVTLFLTTACNLRCTYCYASAGDTPTRAMSPEVARRGIDYVIKNALELGEPGIEVAYHGGGEPSANWATLTESLEHARRRCKELGLSLHTAMATNGVVSPERREWIIQHINGVSLSFDGLPEVHDAHRVTLMGDGSSQRVIETIRRFDEVNYPYGLRLTVTREHIVRLEDSVRFISERFRPTRIQAEPAYQLGRWREAPTAETAQFIEAFRSARAVAAQHGFELQYSAARVGALSNHFCGVTQDSFCLTADGNVSGCYETFLEEAEWAHRFFYGQPGDDCGYRFALPVLNQLRQQSVENRAFCQGCFAKWTCSGDCYHKALTVNGDQEFAGSDRCHITRELTVDQVLEKIARSGGHFWHEPRSESLSQGKELLR